MYKYIIFARCCDERFCLDRHGARSAYSTVKGTSAVQHPQRYCVLCCVSIEGLNTSSRPFLKPYCHAVNAVRFALFFLCSALCIPFYLSLAISPFTSYYCFNLSKTITFYDIALRFFPSCFVALRFCFLQGNFAFCFHAQENAQGNVFKESPYFNAVLSCAGVWCADSYVISVLLWFLRHWLPL